ncbi:MAG: MFS transporter [Rhodospirillaceae bacterium]
MLVVVASNYWLLLVWRTMGAVGYGVAFAACQGYAVDNTTPATRTRGIAIFIGGVMSASICGPSIGGMIADHLGFDLTLLFAAGIMIAAMAVGQMLMGDGVRRTGAQKLGWRELKHVILNPRMLALLIFIAVPAKILLNGALFYLVPLYLTSGGETQSVIGRVMMVYGTTAVLMGPVAAGYADARPHQHHLFVGLGAAIAGLGLAPIGVMPGQIWILVAGIALLGFGQAFSIPVQLALVTQFTSCSCADIGPAAALGVFRFVERAGGALGPILAGFLVSDLGYSGAIACMGQLSGACAFAFLIAFAVFARKASASSIGGQS